MDVERSSYGEKLIWSKRKLWIELEEGEEEEEKEGQKLGVWGGGGTKIF